MAAMAAILDSVRKDFSYFDLYVYPMLPSNFRLYWPLVQVKNYKTDFQDGGHGEPLYAEPSPVSECSLQ